MRRTTVLTVSIIAMLGAVSAGVLAMMCEMTYECTVDFDFVDSASVTQLPSKRPTDPDAALGYDRKKESEESNRRTIADNRTEDFVRYLSWSRSHGEWMKYIRNPRHASCLENIDTNYLGKVLCGATFEIVRMPCDNFVYGCRIRFAASTDENIPEIARACMDVLSGFVADMNEVLVYKAAYTEFQALRKCERRIAQLEKSAEADATGSNTALELARERTAVEVIEKRISTIRKKVLETGEKRIANIVVRTAASIRLRRPTGREAGMISRRKSFDRNCNL